MVDFDNLGQYRENNRIEAKEALGGLPESIWETYSAFANTDGGVILMGVEELPDKRLHALELLDPQWLIEDLWTGLNDPNVVNINILTEDCVQVREVEDGRIIAVFVPKATAQQKPVYIENDLYRGTYRRCGEGDYRCTPEEIDAMLKEKNV